MILVLVLIFFFGLISIAQAVWPSPRAYTECVYVWQEATIYCLGGDIEPCGNNNTSTKHKGDSSNHGNDDDLQSPCRNSTDTFYSLNINQDSNFARLQNSWETVESDLIVSKYFTMSATSISSMNSIVINGGYSASKNISEEYSTVIYDTAGFWVTQDKATDSDGDNPLIYGHAATVSSNETFVYISGGIIFNSDKGFETNTSSSPLVSLPENNLNIFDAKERVWRSVPKPNPEYDEYVRQFHKTVLGNDDIIYFIGGYAPVGRKEYNGMYSLLSVSMSRMTTYDTKLGKWSVTDIYDDLYLAERIHHSATLLPSKNQILVFGGMDTIYGEVLQESNLGIFDINSMTWKIQTLDQEDPNNNSSAITKGHYGHSAIVAEPYLFIMFGFDHNHKATNNTWVIDTRSWKWVTSISKVEPAPPSKGTNDKDNNNQDNNNEGYPTHDDFNNHYGFVIAIAAVAGFFAAVLIIFLAVRCYSRRKKRNQAKSTALLTETDESSAALYNSNRESQDNVIDDRDSIASITDSLPPYRLHDNGHQLPGINDTDDTS